MQSTYISKLMELAERDSRVLHLVADNGTAYDEIFKHNFPQQIFNFGIAEENMVAAAAGLATTGKTPFVYTAGAFLAYRALEFIRDDICFQNLNVKIVGTGSGLTLSSLGPTHHTTEEISVLRAIPNLKILSPATPYEVGACVELAYECDGPVYIRIGMNHEQEYFNADHHIQFAVNYSMLTGSDIVVYSTGSILDEVMKAAELLKNKGITIGVRNVVSLKPFDTKSIIEDAMANKIIVSVEEHNIYGGLGSIIADCIVDNGLLVSLKRIGLSDCFAIGYGTHETVRIANHLDARSIALKIEEAIYE